MQVCCLPGFRQYSHYCPLCNVLIGIGKPSHTGGHIALISILCLITIAVVGFIIYAKIILE